MSIGSDPTQNMGQKNNKKKNNWNMTTVTEKGIKVFFFLIQKALINQVINDQIYQAEYSRFNPELGFLHFFMHTYHDSGNNMGWNPLG